MGWPPSASAIRRVLPGRAASHQESPYARLILSHTGRRQRVPGRCGTAVSPTAATARVSRQPHANTKGTRRTASLFTAQSARQRGSEQLGPAPCRGKTCRKATTVAPHGLASIGECDQESLARPGRQPPGIAVRASYLVTHGTAAEGSRALRNSCKPNCSDGASFPAAACEYERNASCSITLYGAKRAPACVR